jgi:hypothetical protein
MNRPPDPFIIGLSGLAGAGKDTAADRLCDMHGFERHAFAEPIRTMVLAFLVEIGIDYDVLFDRRHKEQPLPHIGASPRQLLQTIGMACREQFDSQFWVRATAMALGLHDLPNSAPVHDRIVITDVRFPEEAAWIKSFGGVIVRIERDGAGLAGRAGQHASEQQHIKATWRITNNGTVPELFAHIDDMAGRLLGTAAPVPQRPQP